MSFKIVLLLLLPTISMAKTYDQFALKISGGASINLAKGNASDEIPSAGFGATTEVGYKYQNTEINLVSFLNYTHAKRLGIISNGSQVHGDGRFRSVSFGPLLRYYSAYEVIRKWNFSFHISPLIGIQTMRYRYPTVTGGNYQGNHKITTEGMGGALGLGLEKYSNDKNKHTFIMLSYKFIRSARVTEIGGTETAVQRIHRHSYNTAVEEHSIYLGFGGVIF
ncbi:MAG: hypothetical protein HOE90_05360 [Bacteriovoracaceae bacterium]|nr:hypothetical protein [Bacteriovoracaceae bacterium]